MQEIEERETMIDVCTSCRGTFLDAGEADHFVDDPAKLGKALGRDLIDPKPGHRCPRCGEPFVEGGLFEAAFRVELCQGCDGMWLVSKQLSRLSSLVANGDPSRQPTTSSRGAPPRVQPEHARTSVRPDPPRCPDCRSPATRWDRWNCSCGYVWDTFLTEGVCPRCKKTWSKTRCPRCGVSSPYQKWLPRPR
jgi:Zn-finger nucleic acid-binding protein